MRLLIIDHHYHPVIARTYETHPGLAREPYAAQRLAIDDALFGQTAFEVAALRELGYEATECLINIRPLQERWASEHGHQLSPATRWGVRGRGVRTRLGRRSDDRWLGEALRSHVRALRPDVVLNQSVDLLRPELIAEIREHTRLIVGMIAADVPHWFDVRPYDLMLSSVPKLVESFRAAGKDALWLPLAFEPTILDRIGPRQRDVAVSFVGSLSPSHPGRVRLLEGVAARSPLEVWTGDADVIAPQAPLRSNLRGPAWGRSMYEVLARSRLTVNNHARIAAGAANNLRLFEGTGMGALVVTEAAPNLEDLFEGGREVVTYRDAAECAEVVRYYLDHPFEAAEIAAAGQRRTLRDHTWRARMQRIVELARSRF